MELLIAGKEFTNDNTYEIKEPFSGNTIDSVPLAGKEDINFALDKGRDGALIMKRLTSFEKYSILSEVSKLITQNIEELAVLLSRETGKLFSESKIEIERTAVIFSFAAEESKRIGGEVVPMDYQPQGANKTAFYRLMPLGLISAITPFNYPVLLSAHKIAPALAAGNSIIVKPSLYAPLALLKLGKLIIKAGLPDEALSIVCGMDEMIGETLISDQRIDMISFTGSAAVGKLILSRAGIKPVSLELGSNAAIIITDKSDIDETVQVVAKGGYANCGQICISLQRIFVQQTIYDEFVKKLTTIVKNFKVGNPFDLNTDVAYMIHAKGALNVKEKVDLAIKQGAKLNCGGQVSGNKFQPAVLSDMTPEMNIMNQELFGPVVCVLPFKNVPDAVSMVNKSSFGLNTGIFSTDINEILYAYENIRTGAVIANDSPVFRVENMPYGGVKQSGFSREGVKYAIQAMTEKRMLVIYSKN